MARRSDIDQAAAAAAAAASEAGRVLQAQRGRQAEPSPEPAPEPAPEPRADKSPPADKPLPVAKNDARDNAMDEILARRAEQPAEEPPEAEAPPKPEIQPDPPPPTMEDMMAGSKFSPAEPAADAPPEVTPEAPPVIEYVRVKVDGEEMDAPKADVEEAGGVRAYQIQRASENRLAKANEALAEAKRVQAAIMAQAQAVANPPPPKVSDDEFIAQRLDLIRYGAPAEAAKAWAEIQGRSAAPPVDHNALVSEAVNRINMQNAAATFNNEFKDLVQDHDLDQIVKSRLANSMRGVQPGQYIDWTEHLRKIGTEVRQKFGRQPQPATPAATSATTGNPSLVSREARKASIVNLPTAASRADVPKEPKPETREEMFADLRKARGFQNG